MYVQQIPNNFIVKCVSYGINDNCSRLTFVHMTNLNNLYLLLHISKAIWLFSICRVLFSVFVTKVPINIQLCTVQLNLDIISFNIHMLYNINWDTFSSFQYFLLFLKKLYASLHFLLSLDIFRYLTIYLLFIQHRRSLTVLLQVLDVIKNPNLLFRICSACTLISVSTNKHQYWRRIFFYFHIQLRNAILDWLSDLFCGFKIFSPFFEWSIIHSYS